MQNKQISVLVDNDSWILPHAEQLVLDLLRKGHDAALVRNSNEVRPGWINFMLGCTRIVGPDTLIKNKHNLVVHESDLPHGRGFAPMAWQILEGKNIIPICLIEAASNVDAGDIWIKDHISLTGTELCDEWREMQGKKTVMLCLQFVEQYASLTPQKQKGATSFYERRRSTDSRIDPNKTLADQFNHLRIVDNERYPAFFEMDGCRYILKIFKM